jgi:hypothetical protein
MTLPSSCFVYRYSLLHPRQLLPMPPPSARTLELFSIFRVALQLVVGPILRCLSEHHTISWAIGQTIILLAAVAILEEVVFGILRLIIAGLRWVFWSIRWTLVCILLSFGKRLLLLILVPQEDEAQ